MSFKEKVLDIVRNIPEGKTLTYKQVAAKAGSPGAARAVGNIMKGNYKEDVPCHRVVKTDGTMGDYNRGGANTKKKLLQKEGAL